MDSNFFPSKTAKYECKKCNHITSSLNDFNLHIESIEHLGKKGKKTEKKISEISQTKPEKFNCELCNITTTRFSHYQNHIKTTKHLLKIKPIKRNKIECPDCNKEYSTNGNLTKHKKICKGPIKESIENNTSNEILVNFITQSKEIQNILIEQNKELQNKIIEQNEQFMKKTEEQSKQIMELTKAVSVTNNITNSNSNNNNTNNQFNIQVFLNDHCKDAINIMDFVDSLKVQVSDLEKTGEIGYVNGITRILVNGLRKLDVCKRPIHCTDIKRETLYIKDQNTWEKENTDKPKLKKAVNRVSQLNLKQLKPWQEQNPEYENLTSKVNDVFIKLSTNAIGSCSSEEDEKNMDKIMKNVLKEVVIERREPTPGGNLRFPPPPLPTEQE